MAQHEKYQLAKQGETSIASTQQEITVGQLVAGLNLRFPVADAEDWDHNGLTAGDPSVCITKVALALDPTPEAIRKAADAGANVLLTHHPVFMEAPDTFTPLDDARNMGGRAIYEALSLGVALINVHTPLDASPRAAGVLPNMLRLVPKQVLCPIATSTEASPKGYGQICEFGDNEPSMTLAQLAARCTSVFGRVPRVWGNFSKKLTRVATWTGSVGNCIGNEEAARIDCLICGEVKYHVALALTQAGLTIIELGHDVSELPLIVPLAVAAQECAIAKENLVTIDQTNNWNLPEARRV